MLKFLHNISSSDLKSFLSNSYSLELLLNLYKYQNDNVEICIEDIFIDLKSPKPKRSTFDKFVKRLIDQKLIFKFTLTDKRKIGLHLSNEHMIILKNFLQKY